MKGSSSTNASNINIAATIGGWIGAAGNILAAIGSTPTVKIPTAVKTDLQLIGNVLQAVGSAISAQNHPLTLDVLGNILQSAGNVTVIAGILDRNETTSQRLETIGNELQLLGAGISIQVQDNLTISQSLNNVGDIIQVIGNALQVYANPNTEQGIQLNAFGSWVQAIGAVISALAVGYTEA